MIYEFTFVLQGEAETEEEALKFALEGFMDDPGEPSETKVIEENNG